MTQNEINHIAKQKDIVKATIDKDWVLGHLLDAFYSFDDNKRNFIFKGGTCLKKCYFVDYRFSEDLDFSLLDNYFPVNGEFINRIIKRAERESEIRFSLSEINEQVYNDIPQGYEIKIKFWGADHKPNSPVPPSERWQTYIKFDISFSETILEKPVWKKIIHPYSDTGTLLNQTIPCYSLVEIMAEKLRALIQRNRPRDVYDVWFIMQSSVGINKRAVKELLLKKAESKNIEIKNVEQFVNEQKQRKNKRAWESSLTQHLPAKVLPDFDMVYLDLYNFVKEILNS